MDKRLYAVHDLMRRMPPQKINTTLFDAISIAPDLCEDILSSIDQPLKIATDKAKGRDYLICDYNRDGDSHRSPWSNTYDPPLEDGNVPSERLRTLETALNEGFDVYRELYFEGGISSVYLWDMEQGFAGVILIKKATEAKSLSGCWDSIHVIDVTERPSAKVAQYKLTSTVMLWLKTEEENLGYFNLGGSLTRGSEQETPLSDSSGLHASHITNIGSLVEAAENSIRNRLSEIYFGTSNNIVKTLRSIQPASEVETRRKLMQEVTDALQKQV